MDSCLLFQHLFQTYSRRQYFVLPIRTPLCFVVAYCQTHYTVSSNYPETARHSEHPRAGFCSQDGVVISFVFGSRVGLRHSCRNFLAKYTFSVSVSCCSTYSPHSSPIQYSLIRPRSHDLRRVVLICNPSWAPIFILSP
jgi:hypothetical protein